MSVRQSDITAAVVQPVGPFSADSPAVILRKHGDIACFIKEQNSVITNATGKLNYVSQARSAALAPIRRGCTATISASLFAADYGHVKVTYHWKDDGHNLGGLLTGSLNPNLLDRLYDEQVQYNFTGLK
ncbi:uncharacterized protein BYT42DRAFT_643276 [Radiomyces spectabilis]|uniref:uncharacterized protein n=1 Tax=Radiomyces spectabilis TaxID=64574 RepID=UPI00221F1097|nr:uncharacterized protein BYT42DRAFT_643276 [Radiomyces spectabilis]KAI8384470.1 hypothetical protein BYT42DRAFT_643276 [Radiomyces spectabilis]